MAGFNTRFHDAGFDLPKYLLPYGRSTVIAEILANLSEVHSPSEIICLANIRDSYFSGKLTAEVEQFGAFVHYIRDTKGQAHTAAIGAELTTQPGPLLIHNADTVLLNRNLAEIEAALRVNTAYVDVFDGQNPAYCFLDIGADNRVLSIAEKKNITKFASSGLYGFSSAERYLELYRESLMTFQGPEIFISDVLATTIKCGTVVANSLNPAHNTVVIGSPQEYLTALESHNDHST